MVFKIRNLVITFFLARSCGDPGSPENGQKNGLLFQFGHSVQFTCNKGYILDGPSNRACRANQTWDKTQPSCKRKEYFAN